MSLRNRSFPLSWFPAAVCTLACLAAGPPARADEFDAPKKAEARSLFDEGFKLLEQERYAEACPKLAASAKLDEGMGVLYRLAQCYEHTGRLASAWTLYLQVVDMAHAARMPEREKVAQAAADTLRVKLAKLLVIVPDDLRAIAGVQIKRDGDALAKESWGIAIPVDGGAHVISVVAPGKREWNTTVQVSATGDGATITVTVPSLKEEPQVGPVGSSSATSAADAPAPGWGAPKIAGAVAAGAGAVGLIVGGVLGGLALGKNNDAAKFCQPANPTLCSAQGVALDQDVKTLGTASTALFIAGGVLAAGGVVLFFVAPSGAAPAKAGSNVRVRMSAGHIGLEGSW